MFLALIGKSGSGKNAIQKELNELGIKSVVPYTTRPMRSDELDGEDYHFISKGNFLQNKRMNFFATTAEYKGWHYGIATEDISRKADEDKVVILSPAQLYELRRRCVPMVAIYLQCDTTTLIKRLLQRHCDGDEIIRRLSADKQDFANEKISNLIDFTYNVSQGGAPQTPQLIAKLIYTQFMQFTKNGGDDNA